MVYTLSLALRDHLSDILEARKARIDREEAEAIEREEQEVARKKQGTQVTRESFLKWRDAFEKEEIERRRKTEEERLKALPPKEREELKKWLAKPTGAFAALAASATSSTDSDPVTFAQGKSCSRRTSTSPTLTRHSRTRAASRLMSGSTSASMSSQTPRTKDGPPCRPRTLMMNDQTFHACIKRDFLLKLFIQ